ncbi:MAG: hypothetical protein ACREXY_05795 [Gammaproteobacteria bacterium]
MELREFVREALSQIICGVRDAQNDIAQSGVGGIVSPPIQTDWEKAGYVFAKGGLPVQRVDFDIAVAVSEKTGTKGAIGIVIAAIGLGSQNESSNARSSDSRIKFSVPIALPVISSNLGSK